MIRLILFGILKGIGILLLVLLLLLLLSLLLVLLSPIRYRLEGQKTAEACGSFGVSWLLGAIRAEGDYSTKGGSRLRLRVLWFTLIGGEKKKKRRKRKKRRQAPQVAELHTAEKQEAQEPPKQEPSTQEPSTQEPPKQEAAEEKPKKQIRPERMAEKQPKTMRRVKLSEITEPETEDEDFFTGEKTEEKEEKEEKKETRIPPIVKELWSIEEKREIFKAFAKLLKRLLKGVLPRDFFLKATIGTGDPCTTGYLLGLAGILTAKFGKAVQVKGDFAKATVEDIEIRMKGRLTLGRLLWAVLAFGLTKPVKRAIRKEIRYFKGKNNAADAKGETA